jgi:hypothetical protein
MARALARQSPFWIVQFLRELAPPHIRGQRNYVREINRGSDVGGRGENAPARACWFVR